MGRGPSLAHLGCADLSPFARGYPLRVPVHGRVAGPSLFVFWVIAKMINV